MKVVTFNTRLDNPEDGAQNIHYRLPFIFETIAEEKPDVIGFQEVLPQIALKLKQGLAGYTLLGHGREEDLSGEQTCIAFRSDKYDLLSMDSFWLSRTPKVPGSRYKDQSVCPRTCTCVTLFDLETGKKVRVYNTHLDHIGSSARMHGLNQISKRIVKDYKNDGIPYILMGDFNAAPNDPEIKAALETGLYKDMTETIGGTFHDFGQEKEPEQIDYIFTSTDFKQKKKSLWTMKRGELFLSDHYPVCCELSF